MGQTTKTFSELWYRVADFQPRLSNHLSVRRHIYRGETWFVLGDPASSKYFRFNAAAYRFLGLLDGQRTVQEAWEVCNAQLYDDAPTQTDCIDLLCQLQNFGLLRGDLPIRPQQLRDRFQRLREQKFQEMSGRYVFWTVPLINPERFLARFANVARLAFSGYGLVTLIILLLVALQQIAPRWEELTGSFNWIIAADNLVYLSLSFLGLKIIHEYAHGFACKAYGGRVTEIGVFFMLVMPIPYCDATASWAFPSKWRRIIVSAAGMMAELAVASIAAIVWARTGAGTVHTVCYNIMIIASVATILFNLNPLLRYDGYYLLADLTETPNLTARSHELMKWITHVYVFGLKGQNPPPLQSRSEGMLMVTHALCAFPYRLLIMIGIVMMVAQKYFVIGLILGILGAIVWLVVPVVKGLAYVVAEPRLEVVRARALSMTSAALIVLALLVGVVPLPSRVYAVGFVQPVQRWTFRAPHNGFIQDLSATDGQYVKKGQLICRVGNPLLDQQHYRALGMRDLERKRVDAAAATGVVERKYTEPLYKRAQRFVELSEKMMADADMIAPFDGWLIAPMLRTKQGTYIGIGTPIATIATLDNLVIKAYVDDRDFAWLFPEGGKPRHGKEPYVQARLYDRPGKTRQLRIDWSRIAKAGVKSIHPSLAMTTQGGSVPLDPSDGSGRQTLTAQWEMTLTFAQPPSDWAGRQGNNDPEDESPVFSPALLPGTRAKVRFTLAPEPLVYQWYRSLRRLFAERFEQ